MMIDDPTRCSRTLMVMVVVVDLTNIGKVHLVAVMIVVSTVLWR
jgi:hypothetical protein